METTLFGILKKKEIIHWKRTMEMRKKFNNNVAKWTMGSIIFILGFFFHYGTVTISTLFEIGVWVFDRKQYHINIQRMALKV